MTTPSVPPAACGTPGPLPYWSPDLDVWAVRNIARFDDGTLPPWHVDNCRRVAASFFGLHGRVLFGVATGEQIETWLRQVEQDLRARRCLEPFVVEALMRVRSGRCRGREDCQCASAVRDADRLLQAVEAHAGSGG
jgi:hypothetical protein